MVKDVLEVMGILYIEVDFILVNGDFVDFFYWLVVGDCIVVYFMFEVFDIGLIVRLCLVLLCNLCFVVDVNFG